MTYRRKLGGRFARGAALCLLALAAALLRAGEARAQWAPPTSGSPDITNTNTGNVGVGGGTAGPADTLSVWAKSTDGFGFRVSGGGQAGRAATNAGVHIRPDATKYGLLSFSENAVADRWVIGIKPSDGNLYFSSGGSTFPSATNRVVFSAGGNVGVGTNNPQTALHVNQLHGAPKGVLISGDEYWHSGNGTGTTGILLLLGVNRPGNRQLWIGDRANLGSPTAGFFRVLSGVYNSMDAVTGDGSTRLPVNLGTDTTNVGVGFNDFSTAPGSKLSVQGNLAVGANYRGAAAPAGGAIIEGLVGIGTSTPGVGLADPAVKLDVAGSVNVSGSINAKYQDVAEWVPSTQRLAAGTVVVLDAGRTNHVLASGREYDTSVAGVVSARPGLILGEGGEGKVMVATTGRVKVRVDATRAPIRIGDLLVTSDQPGVAMRSEPIALGGRQIHAPGTIIGKALEPLEKGTGEILVLLSLQ